jgi:hypothetical protein
MAYSWLTFLAARQQLAARLADPTNQYWTDTENGLYITEALRVWNALTFTWKTIYTFTIAAASAPTWYSLGTQAGSPRLRTLTDTALYTLMEYHLLEPPTGGSWTGTSQFSIADLSLALQRCRDEAIQVTNCNQFNPLPTVTIPNIRTIPLADTYLDVSRAQYVPSTGRPTTLMRSDDTAFNYYQAFYLQTPASTPSQYNIASLPPLTLEIDIPPVLPGAYDLIVLESGPALAPPTPTLLNVPDDAVWVLKWGALADLLDRESEATDRLRASYCRKQYTDGLKLMQGTPWVIEVQINGVPANFVSLTEMDWYNPEWDSAAPDFQTIITAGMDFFTVVPDPANSLSITMTVLGNAPVPAVDGDFIQCSRDVWDAILDYAQFLGTFKQGGAEFSASQPLAQGFFDTAIATNGRLKKLGLFANLYDDEGNREVRAQERYAGQVK